MPTSKRGDKIKFHYNFGDYNNSLKALSHKPKLQIHPWFSHKWIENTLLYLDKSCKTLTSYTLVHTHTEELLIAISVANTHDSYLLHLYL